ncbi:hypothetical protein [Lactobacillus sp. PSON]|uniref:hypothetical protein n=1 Tax=Lactobacillus sp. PSON TaxID=3455454 RepID=UPI004040F905
MNKKVLISLAGAALISTGLATIAVEGGNTVNAAKTTATKGKKKKGLNIHPKTLHEYDKLYSHVKYITPLKDLKIYFGKNNENNRTFKKGILYNIDDEAFVEKIKGQYYLTFSYKRQIDEDIYTKSARINIKDIKPLVRDSKYNKYHNLFKKKSFPVNYDVNPKANINKHLAIKFKKKTTLYFPKDDSQYESFSQMNPFMKGTKKMSVTPNRVIAIQPEANDPYVVGLVDAFPYKGTYYYNFEGTKLKKDKDGIVQSLPQQFYVKADDVTFTTISSNNAKKMKYNFR